MHKINVLSFGSNNFNISLEELKDYLNFKLVTTSNNFKNIIDFKSHDVLLIHQDYIKNNYDERLLNETNKIKILLFAPGNLNSNIFSSKLPLPISITYLNQVVEDSIIKKNFNKNSSITIKDYILDKNEKKLIRNESFILLTEKEIQLLELFLKNKVSLNKNRILSEVWKYAEEADTHTVETHIYRLRKKIKDKFSDDNFILNDKIGYSF
jgi:hypothetical protein